MVVLQGIIRNCPAELRQLESGGPEVDDLQ